MRLQKGFSILACLSVALAFTLASCGSLNESNEKESKTQGISKGNITITLDAGATRGIIAVSSNQVVSVDIILTDPSGGQQSGNWAAGKSTSFVFNATQTGSYLITDKETDDQGNVSVFSKNLDVQAGWNYNVTITIGGTISVQVAVPASSSASSCSSSAGANLVVYFPFENNANDLSGNGHNGSVHGAVTYVDGTNGKAAKFNSSSDFITVDLWQSNSRKWGQDEVTIEFWAKPNIPDENDAFLFDFLIGRSDTDGQLRLVQFDSTEARIGNMMLSAFTSLYYQWDVSKFHHFALSVTKTNVNYYVDSVKVYAEAIRPSIINASMPYELTLGGEWSHAFNHSWAGAMDELKVWNYAKTDF